MACFQHQRRSGSRFVLTIILFGLSALVWSTPNNTLRLLQGQATYYYEINQYNDALASIKEWREYAQQQALTLPVQQWSMSLLEASIYLALGIEQQAESIMIDAQVANVDNLGHAWFLLSRRWQQRGDWERAIKTAQLALAPRNRLSTQWHSEAQFIQALSHAQQLQLEPLAQIVASMPVRDIWTAYARYNWVLALIESYTPSHQIQQVVAETLHYMGDSDEFQQLRQRLLLVASIEALEANNTRLAEQYLTLITQDSAYAAAALLQYSWTSLAQQKWTQALHSLRALQQQHHEFHPAVMESYLLVPYALEQMQATGQAIRAYEQVEQRLLSMQGHIQQARQHIQSNNWLQPWLTDVSDEALWGWQFAPIAEAAEGDLSRLLHGLIEQNTFEVALQEVLDLQRAAQQVNQQLQRIPLWQTLIERRQQHAKEVQGHQQMQGLQRRFNAAQKLIAERHADLEQQAKEAFAYSTAEETQALQVQQSILRRIQVLQQRGYIAGPALSDYQERWRRIRGLQLWHNNHVLPERRWQAVQALQNLQRADTQLQRQRQHTDMALRWMQGDWQGLNVRLQQQREIGEQLQQRLIALQQQQQAVLEQRVSQHLAELDQRVLDYLAQTRLAIARLYDDALQQQLERQLQEVDRDDA